MSFPLVSIIIPAYNHANVLERCLHSIEKQTYQNIEIIVVDDGSTDETAKQFSSRSSSRPYHFFRCGDNRGASAARNEGARMASGEYLLFIDADAELRADAVEQMVKALDEHPDVSFAYPSFRFGWKSFRVGPFDPEALRRGPMIHTTALIRRDAFPGFDESFKKFQDWDLWLTVVERGGEGVWIPEELFQISVRRNGISSWMPSIIHRLPWPILGWMPREIARYREWERIVKQKHGIAT